MLAKFQAESYQSLIIFECLCWVLNEYLLIELDGAFEITNAEHDLAKWLRGGGPLNNLKRVTIRILHKGYDARPAFHRARLPRHISTLSTNIFHQFFNLQNPKFHKIITFRNNKLNSQIFNTQITNTLEKNLHTATVFQTNPALNKVKLHGVCAIGLRYRHSVIPDYGYK